MDVTNELYDSINSGNPVIYDGIETNHITDISRHSIVIFEAFSSGGINDEVYTEFNYAISRIVHDIRVVNDGLLPKMNLIGHSRGGITNMQYALDHPDLVHSIYSLGTPYTGSTSASLDRIWFGSMFSGSPEASEDITSKDVYGKYMNRWNQNFASRYSHIDITALGGYGTLLNLAAGLTTDTSLDFLHSESGVNKTVIKYGIPAALGALNGFILSQYFTPVGITNLALQKLIAGAVSELATNLDLSDMAVDDLIQILTNELNLDYHPPFVSWYNDGLVDLGSQLGYEGLIPLDGQQYKGFKRVTKTFMLNNTEFEKHINGNACGCS